MDSHPADSRSPFSHFLWISLFLGLSAAVACRGSWTLIIVAGAGIWCSERAWWLTMS